VTAVKTYRCPVCQGVGTVVCVDGIYWAWNDQLVRYNLGGAEPIPCPLCQGAQRVTEEAYTAIALLNPVVRTIKFVSQLIADLESSHRG